ncbi:MAG: O-antigen ligase family protein [bacterium]|nr:O-antigen ligase family protein [bacterium]
MSFKRERGLFQRVSFYYLLILLAFIPIFFGSIHPLVQGVVVGLLLLYAAVAVWLDPPQETGGHITTSLWFLLFFFVLLQSLPLPLSWLQYLAPMRFYWLEAVNSLAHTEIRFAATSYLGTVSLFHLALYVSAIPLFMLAEKAFTGKEGRSRHRIACVVLISVGALEAMYGVFQFINPKLGVLWLPISSRAAHGTIIYTNHYGALLNLCWPQAWGLALYFLVRAKHKAVNIPQTSKSFGRELLRAFAMPWETYALLFAAVLMMAAVVFSLSRGAILSLIGIGAALLVVLPVPRGNRKAFFGVFLGMFLLLSLFLDFSVIWERFSTIEESGLTRLQLYAASMPLLWDHWSTGIGLGAYTVLSPLYLKNFPGTIHFDHAHNEFLEIFIELGIPLGCIFILLIALYLKRSCSYIIKIRNNPSQYQSRIVIGCAAWCSLIGFLLHGTVDFGWRLPVNLYYVAVLLAQISIMHRYCMSNYKTDFTQSA